MVQITQRELTVAPGVAEKLSRDYQESGLVLLPEFIAPPILKHLLQGVEQANFHVKAEPHIEGKTLHIGFEEPVYGALHFLLNRRDLFDLVTAITGISGLRNFTSRMHRTTADSDQHLDWHDDGTQGRLVGLNISLTTSDYTGGLLQLRDPDKRMRGQIGRLQAGDAFIFRIGQNWQHRLTPVQSGVRTVAVGWFRSFPDWTENAAASLRGSLVGQ